MITTIDMPEKIHQAFEREAISVYGTDGLKRAIVEAVEMWLARRRRQALEAERKLNNRAYQALKEQLARDHPGKYVVIAHGRLQATGDQLKDLRGIAPDALHRLVFQVGRNYPRELELGWTTETHPFAGPVQTAS